MPQEPIDVLIIGAGQLGLASVVETAIARTPPLHAMIAQGLADLDATAHDRHGRGFAELSRSDKVTLLNEQGFLLPLSLYACIA